MTYKEFTKKYIRKHKPWIEFIGISNWNKLVGQIYDNGVYNGRKQTLEEVIDLAYTYGYTQFAKELEQKIEAME